MITKNTYKKAQIAVLSGVAEYKNGNKKEVIVSETKDDFGALSGITTIENISWERFIYRWYWNGILRRKIEYKKFKKHGKDIVYYSNGSKEQESEYKNGELNGDSICYFVSIPNCERIYKKEKYKNGKLNGWSELYDLNFSQDPFIRQKTKYSNGDLRIAIRYYTTGRIAWIEKRKANQICSDMYRFSCINGKIESYDKRMENGKRKIAKYFYKEITENKITLYRAITKNGKEIWSKTISYKKH